MNNSSNHNHSNEASKNNQVLSKDEEAELRSLLSSCPEQPELTALQELLEDSKLDAENLSQVLPKDEFAELRSLLLKPEQTKLGELQERLVNPKLDAENLSQVLPEAIILRTLRDQRLAKALVPTIEEAIRISVKKDLKILGNAFSPVMLPGIRKAIGTALNTMTQSLDQTLRHSLSPQSFKWRLEARQTGKSFAEVVLLRTLLYRVEQVFLIHKKTGLLLQHVVAKAVVAQDGDLVSAMLTAIQDFVKDSFSVKEGDSLETLHFGELTIWIEQGPQAILAAVIRGNAPQEIRSFFQDAIESINLEQSNALEAFDGDTAPFEAIKPYLEECLLVQFEVKEPRKKSKKRKFNFRIALGAILVTFGPWAFFYIQSNQRWATYLEKLNAERGIVVVAADKRHGKFFISGLRDPMAADPRVLMKAASLSPQQVISRWELYLSEDAKFIEARANKLLQPPESVSIKVDENGILYSTGAASEQWIAETRRLVKLIPGVREFREINLIDIDLSELESTKAQIEKHVVRFVEGTQLAPGQENTLQNLVREISKLYASAQLVNKGVQIKIVGHTDKDGVAEANMRLSQARAQKVLSTLVSKGLKPTNLTAVGVGAREPLGDGFTAQDKELNRRVSFKVILSDAFTKEAP